MRPLLLALALAPGCAFYEPRTCDLDRELEARLGGEILDCGSSIDAPIDELWAAHDCALRAASSRTPFLVRWQSTGFEGPIIRAYGGDLADDGTWQSYQFTRAPTGVGGGVVVNTLGCFALGDRGTACGDEQQSLCITCVNAASLDNCVEE